MNIDRVRWERWERIRSRGFTRFVLLYGIGAFGLPSGGLMAVVFPTALNFFGRSSPDLWLAGLPFLVLGPICGALWGLGMWLVLEKSYLAARAAEQTQQEHKAALDALTREVQELRQALDR
jgi:hypothetical protein